MKKNLRNKEVGKIFFLSIIIGMAVLSILNIVYAQETSTCDLNITLVNQDPYPAVPDSYVDLVFQMTGVSSPKCDGARIELLPSYPFSLDTNDSLRILEGNTWMSSNKNEWMIAYKVRVDKDALDGVSEIEIGYAPKNWVDDSWAHKKFDVAIKDSRTIFDAVIQESSSSEVSIAIANAGKNTANSVVVRIPEQEYFRATGTSGQMVGNLESGDYTIVSFSVSRVQAQRTTNKSNSNLAQSNNLKFDIYYTDNLGERRVVNMDLPLNSMSNTNSSSSFFSESNMPAGMRRNTSNNYMWYVLGPIILVVLIVVFVLYRKRKHAKAASKTKKESPDWMISNKKDKK